MAYKQNWGMSRNISPLNNKSQSFRTSGESKDSDIYKQNFGSSNSVDEDPGRNDIIQQNNNFAANQNSLNAFKPGIDLKSQAKKKVITQIAKRGVFGGAVKNIAKVASRMNPVAAFFEAVLGSQNAYAPPKYNDKYFEDQEREFQYKRDVEGMTKKEVMEFDGMSENAKNFIRRQRGTNKGPWEEPKEEYKPKHVFKQG
jgi:hypothetical protein